MRLQGIADEMEGKVSVVKIDTDKYPNIASRYGIKVCHKSFLHSVHVAVLLAYLQCGFGLLWRVAMPLLLSPASLHTLTRLGWWA